LLELPAKIPDLAERSFLDEGLRCLRCKAFRASIVMTWNLAYDHLCRYIDFIKVCSVAWPNDP
jgi:hypothetical protein